MRKLAVASLVVAIGFIATPAPSIFSLSSVGQASKPAALYEPRVPRRVATHRAGRSAHRVARRVAAQVTRRPAFARVPTAPAWSYVGWAETRATSLANASRSRSGVATCAPNGSLASYARSHSASMANAGAEYHSSQSQLWAAADSACGSCRWVGEIVGIGKSVDAVHAAFLRSPSHRDTMLNSKYRLIGAGVVLKNGRYYVTEIFAG